MYPIYSVIADRRNSAKTDPRDPMSSPTDRPTQRANVSRRDFLAAGGLGFVGLPVAERRAVLRAQERSGPRSVLLVIMNGGPSHLETFDPKPEADSRIRGPLRPVSTAVSGVCFSEALPGLARQADRFAVIRSLHHEAAPIHETGLQLLQTGALGGRTSVLPSVGSATARLLGPRDDVPPYVLLPGPVRETGVTDCAAHGPGSLGGEWSPLIVDDMGTLQPPADPQEPDGESLGWNEHRYAEESTTVRDAYGETVFGCRLWRAARLVEAGVRMVTVNLCERLRGEVTWDAHADPHTAPATLIDYRDTLGPQFDRAASALLDDLEQSGLLSETLVICTGEFGRTPRLNAEGGRDHWPHCWSALVAGAGIEGGQIIGASDARGEHPIDRPVSLPELVATAYSALRIDPIAICSAAGIEPDLLTATPIIELVA